MHNIEEKGAVSTNGIALGNGLSNKETDDTWADLNKAIDNEINGCSEDAKDKPSINDKQNTIKKNDVISETSSNSVNDKPDKTIIDLECSDKEVGDKPGNDVKSSNHEGLNEKDIELPLVDDDVPSENKTSDDKMTNETNNSKETSESSEITDKSKLLSHSNETSVNDISSSCDSSKVMKEELDGSKVPDKNMTKTGSESLTDSKSVKSEKAKSEDVKLEQESKGGLFKTTSVINKNEKHTEDLNYDSALQELSDITKYAKELDDDHSSAGTTSTISSSSSNVEQTQKRKLDEEPSNDSHTSLKRTKVDNQGKLDKITNDANVASKAIKKQLKRISRTEMEDLVARKVVEVISCRSEIGDLRAKCDKYEEMNDKWKRKTQALQKMCQDLNTVIKRYIVDVKNKKDNPTPIKITRSVGLQVCADSRRRAPVPPQQSTSAQSSKQVTSQKLLAQTNTQKRMVSGNQASNALKGPMTNSLPNVGNSTSPNDSNKSSKPLQNTITSPVSSVTSNAGNRVMQSLPQHPLINRSPVNNQKGTPIATQMTAPSSGTKGYLATQGVILQSTPAALVTAAPSQIGNSSSVRTALPTASQLPGVVQQASTNSVSSNAQSNTTSNKTPVGTSNSSGLATATAASNKVIDLVELSDEEDGPTNPQPQSQPKPALPAQRSQQQTNTNNRNGLGPNPGFPNQLPQHKPQQVVNRIHAPNPSRSTGTSGGGIRPMVFANQMANGVNVHRPPPLANHRIVPLSHPAPLPEMPNPQPHAPSWKKLPPRPTLKISRLKSGIVLSWNMDVIPTEHAAVASYQIYAYQEGSAAPQSGLWKKVGDVKALPLPMACTLTQFTKGNKYHFAVRAQDVHSRVGSYSDPQSIALT